MSAFMIVTVSISDRDRFLSGYAPAAALLVEEFGGRYLLRGPISDTLEGEPVSNGSVVVSEWPDRETALKFWNSDAYRDVKTLRDGICDARVVIVDSVTSPDLNQVGV